MIINSFINKNITIRVYMYVTQLFSPLLIITHHYNPHFFRRLKQNVLIPSLYPKHAAAIGVNTSTILRLVSKFSDEQNHGTLVQLSHICHMKPHHLMDVSLNSNIRQVGLWTRVCSRVKY